MNSIPSCLPAHPDPESPWLREHWSKVGDSGSSASLFSNYRGKDHQSSLIRALHTPIRTSTNQMSNNMPLTLQQYYTILHTVFALQKTGD